VGTAWQNRGHDVTFGVRNPDDPKYASLGAVRANEAAASAAEAVVLCTPWQGTQEAVQGCGDLPDFGTLEVGLTTSGAEQVADWRRGFGTDFGFGLLRGRA
jgi:predicted dinucleotide-binding enzyme